MFLAFFCVTCNTKGCARDTDKSMYSLLKSICPEGLYREYATIALNDNSQYGEATKNFKKTEATMEEHMRVMHYLVNTDKETLSTLIKKALNSRSISIIHYLMTLHPPKNAKMKQTVIFAEYLNYINKHGIDGQAKNAHLAFFKRWHNLDPKIDKIWEKANANLIHAKRRGQQNEQK